MQQIEVGAVLEGRVTSITKFGAFVALPENKTGMVHISEVSTSFVRDISEHLQEQQTIKVKVIGIDQNGRINLSIKQLEGPPPAQDRQQKPQRTRRSQVGWQPKPTAQPTTFEEMMNKFKQDSDDKISSIKRGVEAKRGSGSRRGGKY
ncbi:MAG TPA: S1 RNA-binding domain-containing protein [Candidatus Acidoferrum sp.]|nr:S1 RNA-binding domain-containing protein [Candidatus Acidoferrum sp.]